MQGRRWIAALVLMTSFVGCYESRDAPPEAYRRDGSVSQLDGSVGQLDGGGTTFDGATAGPVDAGPLQCGQEIPAFVGPGCAATTRACAQACEEGDGACVDGCIARDSVCVACVDNTLVRCANSAGCQPGWEAFACCAHEQPACARRSGLDLFVCRDACMRELAAFDECLSDAAPACLRQIVERCALAE
ncbi:hypothetical protein [Sandaracinus amylolyticus]|uniref:Uncharacterized protein n=1 Tax=Sandaracinus amylolyticus TaxID=927083 RepID=A0A0F6YGF3_9BACT|nr:hypothetical protein [Sandaracinus amylolyticus]AKF03603.1 hypothetical protein DB32_000752 [Sandaracinus amylolyticus]